MKYEIWSKQKNAEGIVESVLELTRTDKATAYNDSRILNSVCGRRFWVEEVDE